MPYSFLGVLLRLPPLPPPFWRPTFFERPLLLILADGIRPALSGGGGKERRRIPFERSSQRRLSYLHSSHFSYYWTRNNNTAAAELTADISSPIPFTESRACNARAVPNAASLPFFSFPLSLSCFSFYLRIHRLFSEVAKIQPGDLEQ